jgi:geranylgeranyl pyrophosphate synthase
MSVLSTTHAAHPKKQSQPANRTVSRHIRQWFAPGRLEVLMGRPVSEAQRAGQEWLLTGGKRWRPLLTAAVFKAAGGELGRIEAAALAVECFHKASLIHDDIEDGDLERYGVPTVHARVGVPAAINVGDYLIGEGYRLLASADFPGDVRADMLLAAAQGHRALCLGQGDELAFCRRPAPVTEQAVLRIYERKTAAAFEVAMLVGAVAAGVDAATRARLSAFSRAVGTAYQIQDDMEDFTSVRGRAADLLAMRPTLFLAAACASGHPAVRRALGAVWAGDAAGRARLIEAVSEAGLRARVEHVYAGQKTEAARVLAELSHAGLKRLLRRIMARMLR